MDCPWGTCFYTIKFSSYFPRVILTKLSHNTYRLSNIYCAAFKTEFMTYVTVECPSYMVCWALPEIFTQATHLSRSSDLMTSYDEQWVVTLYVSDMFCAKTWPLVTVNSMLPLNCKQSSFQFCTTKYDMYSCYCWYITLNIWWSNKNFGFIDSLWLYISIGI